MSTYTVRYGQSLIDIAIQVYGTVEAMFDLCLDNDLEFDSNVSTGQLLVIRDTLPDTADADMVSYFTAKGIVVVSGITVVDQIFEEEFEIEFE